MRLRSPSFVCPLRERRVVKAGRMPALAGSVPSAHAARAFSFTRRTTRRRFSAPAGELQLDAGRAGSSQSSARRSGPGASPARAASSMRPVSVRAPPTHAAHRSGRHALREPMPAPASRRRDGAGRRAAARAGSRPSRAACPAARLSTPFEMTQSTLSSSTGSSSKKPCRTSTMPASPPRAPRLWRSTHMSGVMSTPMARPAGPPGVRRGAGPIPAPHAWSSTVSPGAMGPTRSGLPMPAKRAVQAAGSARSSARSYLSSVTAHSRGRAGSGISPSAGPGPARQH